MHRSGGGLVRYMRLTLKLTKTEDRLKMKNENWEKAKKIFADAIKFAPVERVRFLDDV